MRTATGAVLLIIAFGTLLSNMSETVTHLMTWSDAFRPPFIGMLMKQLGSVITAAIGGLLLPPPGGVRPA